MTNEEFRKYVYSQYQCGIGGGFKSPRFVVQTTNGQRLTNVTNRGYASLVDGGVLCVRKFVYIRLPG